ncbi:MAG: AAA family ATPase [Rhodospirillales bacterium]|nr:AAA family ATPase [Rhodospirillales bacterium]
MALAAEEAMAPAGNREPFAAFIGDDVTRAALAKVAIDNGWSDQRIFDGGIAEGMQVLSGIPTPDLLITDLSGSPDPLDDMGKLAQVCDQNTRVIALGTINDISLYRALADLGIEDYLLKPVSSEVLAEVINKVAEQPAAPPREESPGRVVTVIGARGGVGATSVSVNSAWLIANELEKRVALVDLDLHFGTVALSLDVEPGRGFCDAIETPNRIDGLFLERAVVRVGKNLFVLGSEGNLGQTPNLSAAAIDSLLVRLRSDFDTIVFDIPRHVALAIPELVAVSQSVVLVSDLSLPGMRDTLRLSEFVRQAAPKADLRVVVNAAGQSKKGEIGAEEFEQHVEAKLSAVLPRDLKIAAKSAGQGRPLVAVAPKSKYSAGLRPLSRDLAGIVPPVKKVLWRRVLGRKG